MFGNATGIHFLIGESGLLSQCLQRAGSIVVYARKVVIILMLQLGYGLNNGDRRIGTCFHIRFRDKSEFVIRVAFAPVSQVLAITRTPELVHIITLRVRTP